VKDKTSPKTYYFIAAAAILWGTIGPFVRILTESGFSSNAIVFIRLSFGFVVLSLYLLRQSPKLLKINVKGLMACAMVGLITQTGFNLAYVRAINLIGVSLSAVLLYLAPLFLLLWSVWIFKEKPNVNQVIGVGICIIGAALAVTGGNLSAVTLSLEGILMGILSAVFYSLMTVFSRLLLKSIPAMTLIVYSFFFGALFTLPTMRLTDLSPITQSPINLLLCVAMGLVPAALAYILYFKGMERQPDLAVVGVLSTLELIFSLFFAVLLFSESITRWNTAGVILIIISIAISQLPIKPTAIFEPLKTK
jgi:drug/metabolite transporter (DMT)-like permease